MRFIMRLSWIRMLDQVYLYAICYVLGWFPIQWCYEWLSIQKPYDLELSKVELSREWLNRLIVIGLEVFRGYYVMVIAHELLAFDIDLIVALVLFLVGLFWPIGVKSNRRSPIWYGLTGIYLYLFPIYGALFPVAIFSALLFGGSIFIVYIASIIAFFLMRLSTGLNSLYFQEEML